MVDQELKPKLKIADSLLNVLRASGVASRILPRLSAQFSSRFYQMSLVGEPSDGKQVYIEAFGNRSI